MIMSPELQSYLEAWRAQGWQVDRDAASLRCTHPEVSVEVHRQTRGNPDDLIAIDADMARELAAARAATDAAMGRRIAGIMDDELSDAPSDC